MSSTFFGKLGSYKSPVFYYLSEKFGLDTVTAALNKDVVIEAPECCSEQKTTASAEATEHQPATKAAATKKVVINKSTLVIDIKPNNIETDLDALEKSVRKIQIEGLEWSKASRKVPVAFGLVKLQMGCVIIDELVATDDVIECIETIGMSAAEEADYRRRRETGEEEEDDEDDGARPGAVQSAEIVSFQKL